jgi:hypothetical protein
VAGGAYNAGRDLLSARRVSPDAAAAARRGIGVLGEIALSREARAAIGQAAALSRGFGGAAADSAIPVSSGGTYHPEWRQRVAGAGEALAHVGQLIWTPELIRNRLNEIDANARSLDAQIQADAARIGEGFARGWRTWFEAWREFWTTYAGPDTSWWDRMWGGVTVEAQRFADALEWWRGEYARLAGRPAATPPTSSTTVTLSDVVGSGAADAAGSLATAAVAGAVIVGVGAVIYLSRR